MATLEDRVRGLIKDPLQGMSEEQVVALFKTDAVANALAHEAPQFLIDRFCGSEDLSQDQAREVFEETKRFLIVSEVLDTCLAPSLLVDNMWHAWLLFTRDYSSFCERFGGYIHHLPMEQGDPRQPPLEPTIQLMELAFGPRPGWLWPVELGAFGCRPCGRH